MELQNLTTTLIYVAVSLLLVFLNAFFVASEFAIVKVRRTRLEELAGQGIESARISILCVDRLDEYLSATQLGITLVSLALGWVGEESFFNLMTILIPQQYHQLQYFHILATATSFFVITMLHVVLGELVPKSMAIQRAEQITLFLSYPLRVFYKVAKPLILVFTWMANAILTIVGFAGLEELPVSEDELKLIMQDSKDDGVISESEAQIIAKAFSFSDKKISDIMISADKVDYLSLAKSFEENMAVTQKRRRTRFPLAEDGIDSIIGLVHIKDIFQQLDEDHSNNSLKKLMRPVTFVEPTLPQDRLLKIFKERRVHMAVVRDSKQKVLGVVTMEDILEELIGDIQDEHGN